MFPKAQLISTHRELKPVLLSLLYLLVARYSFACKEIDLHEAGTTILDKLIKWGKGANECQLLDKERVINVLFRQYASDNRGCIKRILAWLKVECSNEDWSRIEEYLTEKGEFQKNRVQYEPDAFGMDMAEVEDKLAFYSKFMEGLSIAV